LDNMKQGDVQKAMPGILYTDTKANVEALTGVVEGAQAYATDTDEPGWYDGGAWVWGAGGGGGIPDPPGGEQGDILYYDGADWVRLPHGANTDYLKSGGHAANPGWNAPAGGGTLTRNGNTTNHNLAVWNGNNADSLEDGGAVPVGGGDVATDPIWDAKGDLAAGTGPNTASKLTVGTDGKYLKAASGEATGLIWDIPGDVLWSAILASQLVNEIKGWPPCVKTGDLDALNLWWDKVGTPTTAPSVVAVSGIGGGVTETYGECLKLVADAANEGLYQRFTYADEPRIKLGRKLSTLWAIWCVGGVGATLSLTNSDASETAAAKVTAAAWTIVEVPNHTLAGTYVDVKILADGAGTFYAVPLGANIGARGIPLGQRPSRYVDVDLSLVVNGVDPGGAGFVDVDFTATTSNLAHKLDLNSLYRNNITLDTNLKIRRNGSADAVGMYGPYCNVLNRYAAITVTMPCDDEQIIEYTTGAAAANVEEVYIGIMGYWEWG
jgi:hypothetical protein